MRWTQGIEGILGTNATGGSVTSRGFWAGHKDSDEVTMSTLIMPLLIESFKKEIRKLPHRQNIYSIPEMNETFC